MHFKENSQQNSFDISFITLKWAKRNKTEALSKKTEALSNEKQKSSPAQLQYAKCGLEEQLQLKQLILALNILEMTYSKETYVFYIKGMIRSCLEIASEIQNGWSPTRQLQYNQGLNLQPTITFSSANVE